MASDEQTSPDSEQGPLSGPPLKVLLDLNVVLDVLQNRASHYEASAKAWAAVEEGTLEGCIAAHSVTTLFYLLSQYLEWTAAVAALEEVLEVFSVATVDEDVIRNALSFGWRDFEDAVQMAAAASAKADFLITRNPKDFKTGPVAVLQPAELPAILQPPS